MRQTRRHHRTTLPIRGTTRLSGVVLALACGVASLTLASCSSSPSSSPAKAVVVKPGKPVPFSLAHNARADVTTKTCAMQGVNWVLQGTVKNPSTSTASYQIVVDFVTNPGNTVLSTTVVNVPGVAAGAAKDWSATGARGEANVACIVRQAQTT